MVFIRSLTVAVLALASWIPSSLAADNLWQPSKSERAALQAETNTAWTKIFINGGLAKHTPWNDLADLLLNGLATGLAPQKAAAVIDALAALQVADDPKKPAYGNIRWYTDDTALVDNNGIEFVTRAIAVAWILYADRIGDVEKSKLLSMLQISYAGIRRHIVSVSYTNIYLMKAWNLIALGQILKNADYEQMGISNLSAWLNRANRSGIDEYLSPAYYGVDLENLALIRNLATNSDARALAQQGLDLLWSDLALHWYAPGDRLGGPHSRDYDRPFNQGKIDDHTARAGWGNRGKIQPGPFAAYAFAAPSKAASAWLTQPLPRSIIARTGDRPDQVISSYIGKNIYVGSALSGYGDTDNSLTINLGKGADTPTISAFMDARGDYYGLNRAKEAGSGHWKALHLKPFIASVQNGPEVLYLTSVPASAAGATQAIATTLILPADAEYWLDGRCLGTAGSSYSSSVSAACRQSLAPKNDLLPDGQSAGGTAYDRSLPQGSTLIVRRGAAAVAFRPTAWDLDGSPAAFHLIIDGVKNDRDDGRNFLAMRMTAIHSGQGDRATSLIYVLGAEGLSRDTTFTGFLNQAQNVKIRYSGEGARFTAESNRPGSGPFSVTADFERGTRVISPPPPKAVRSVTRPGR